MTAYFLPGILITTVLYSLSKGIDVFSVFLQGAQKGIRTAISLLPTLIALLTAVHMLRASGAIDLVGAALAPLFERMGIPSDCTALVLLKPFSGSGGLALGADVMRRCGVDSLSGRTAAVMLSASETSFYTIGVYTSHAGIKKTRCLIPAAVFADLTAFTAAALFVKLWK